MPSHPNRSARQPKRGRNPSPGEIVAARQAAGQTQAEAADVVLAGARTWQQWEAGDRRMHPASFELYLLRTTVLPEGLRAIYHAALEAGSWTDVGPELNALVDAVGFERSTIYTDPEEEQQT